MTETQLPSNDPDTLADAPAPHPSAPEPDAIDEVVLSRRGWALNIRPVDVLFYALLIAILAAGAWLRFDAQNWDDYTHLHPDERFLTDVVSLLNGPLQFTDPTPDAAEQHRLRCEARYPAQVSDTDDPQARLAALQRVGRGGYFDAECSPLNPNNLGKGLYVYGEFPLFTVHLAGVARSHLSRDVHALLETFDPQAAAEHRVTTHWETYAGAQLVGRTVSATADWLTIVVLFLLGRRLYGRWTGLLAAGFYAVAAFPIQQAHFWTVDAFTTLWVTLALYLAVRALDGASALRGAPALTYLALWAGAVIWETAYWEHPVLGAALLGGLFLIVLAVMALLRGMFPPRLRRSWLAASAAVASVLYLAVVTALDVLAPRPFPLASGMQALGLAALLYALAVLALELISGALRGPRRVGEPGARPAWVAAALGITWLALMGGLLLEVLAPWAALLVALGGVALLILDVTDLADYALFGAALGGAVASRINVAPLAGIIVLAAAIRLLPVLDRALDRSQRSHIVAQALSGVMAAAVVALVVFRLLQPHAFLGPEIWGLRFNPGWLEDIRESAVLTSGQWDGPPNHQWASRTPYLFPWRNIVLWGFGPPLGLVAWGAWAWAGLGIARARPQWTRHLIPFAWVLIVFAWLGGRWVTTMRYFLPIYPPLALLAAWGLIGLVAAAWRRYRARPDTARRWVLGGAVGLVALVYGYTALFGFGFHTIHRTQLTRVAASRWFQETVPGDFGIWIDAPDGRRKLVNIGRGTVAPVPRVLRLEQGESAEVAFSVPGEARVLAVTFHHLADPDGDPDPETLRVRLWRNDLFLGRQLEWEGTLTRDLSRSDSPYGTGYRIDVDDEVVLVPVTASAAGTQPYALEITALDGGPITVISGVLDGGGTSLDAVTIGVQSVPDDTVSGLNLSFDTPPLIRGYGDDIPATPTHWTAGGSDRVQFAIPIDGVIETIEIPHLGDPLGDAAPERVRFTLIGPDGETRTVTIEEDLSAGANPLGPPRTLTFDPPLPVRRFDEAGVAQVATLVIEAEDPIYTSGPVIAWEGDWDDPVPWPVCPLPDDVFYRDDLPSGLSGYDCGAIGMYGAHYQGLKLWMVAEDNDQKFTAMTNALDQADYIVITSNRFYDSLSRIPMRWPMTMAFYDALFDGRLGFELVKTFESYPRLGPITIPDQILPTGDHPAWLNEHWEAEEAYHVYDHPAVLVFRKTDTYSPENTVAILNSVSRRPVTAAVPGYTPDPEPVGLFAWNAVQASQAPTLLQFTADQWAIQRAGGTWRELFDLDALINRNQVVAVVIWWLAIAGVGWLVWPLLFAAFPALADRAFPAARITAWLLVAWMAWVGGTLKLLTWTRTGLALIVLGLVGLALLAGWSRRAALRRYLRANWRHLLAVEALGLVLFLAFLGVRLGNPDLWQSGLGGEKPMDLAYFNGVLRSTIFPPIDPWFAGGYINYYYFGYVIVGAPVKLLGLDPAIAYNLIIPTLYAMTGLGVFSIAYNWVRARAIRPGQITGATHDAALPPAEASAVLEALPIEPPALRSEARPPRGSAWVAGILALVLAIVIGNLGTVLVFVREVAALDGWQQQPLLSQVVRAELESQRPAIYDRYYREVLEEFRDDAGRDPADFELGALVAEAQARTDAYIAGRAKHPPLTRIWDYGLSNLRGQLRAFLRGLARVLDGEPLSVYSNRWHWGPTRIISELPGGAGHNAINEMPYFTFLYGDLHAHMISMPVYLLALLWLLAEINGAGWRLRRGWEAGLALAIGGLAVGILRPTNTWDWITFLILGVAGLTYAAWLAAVRATGHQPPSPVAERLWALLRPGRVRELWPLLLIVPLAAAARVAFYVVQRVRADEQLRRGLRLGETLIDPSITVGSLLLWIAGGLAVVVGVYVALLIALRARIDRPRLLGWLRQVIAFVVVVFVVALPFTRYFATPYSSVKPWEAETTPLWAYLYIHGIFIFIVISFLVWQTARWLRRVRVRELEGLAVPVIGVGLALVAIVLFSIVFGVREVPVAQLVVPLIAWATVLFFLPRQAPLLRAVYALIVLALAISLGVELVVLDGDIGRQNTVFKFYLQVWFLLSITGGVALAWMLQVTYCWAPPLRAVWQGALGLLIALGLLYPIMATRARFEDRFNKAETPLTLDGLEYMKHARHYEGNAAFSLAGDYAIIRWLQENVEGTPVIVEGRRFPSEYAWNGRISINTGLPTILGWRWHQTQQRGLDNLPLLVQARENNVAAIYTLPQPALGADPQLGLPQAVSVPLQDDALADAIRATWKLLRHYEVEYIIVGTLEHALYGDFEADPVTGMMTAGHAPGLAKFERMAEMGLLEIVYEAPRCIDYATLAVEDCPAESMYYDRIYRVVRGAALPESLAAR